MLLHRQTLRRGRSQAYRELIEKFDADHDFDRNPRRAARGPAGAVEPRASSKDDLPEAEEWLEQVLDEFPDDAGALNDLGYLWADQNKHLERA